MPAYKTRLHIADCYAYKRKCKRKAQYEVKGSLNESYGFFCSFCADRLIRDVNKNRVPAPKPTGAKSNDRKQDTA